MIGPICPDKLCSKCKIIKPLIEFTYNSQRKTGRGATCVECSRIAAREYSRNHQQQRKEYRDSRKEITKEYHKQLNKDLKREKQDPSFKKQKRERKQIPYEKVRERKREEYKLYHKKNPHKQKEYYKNAAPRRLEQVKSREQTDLDFKLRRRCRHRMNLALKGESRDTSSLELLGCTMSFFRQWIEKNFEQGMKWENYGYGKEKWNLDHNIPCSSFDLTSIDQQKRCFNWTNVFPMWQRLNFSKNDNLWIIDYEI